MARTPASVQLMAKLGDLDVNYTYQSWPAEAGTTNTSLTTFKNAEVTTMYVFSTFAQRLLLPCRRCTRFRQSPNPDTVTA